MLGMTAERHRESKPAIKMNRRLTLLSIAYLFPH
jgi:hypothetical protein